MKIAQWLYSISHGWLALISTAVFMLFMVFVLPAQADQAEETTQGAGSVDTSFFYSPADLFEIAEAYGEEGRKEYIHTRFTFDLVYPIVYGSFLTVTISWFLNRALSVGSRWWVLNLMPLIGVGFDYLENIAASLVLGFYPTRLTVAAVLSSVFTPIKWVFVGASFLVLLAAAWMWLLKLVRK